MKKQSEGKEGLSRRNFVAGMSIGLAGAAAATLTACASDESNGSSESAAANDDASGIAWDRECDFVQIGAGCGLIAAAYAAAQGDSVITLEKNGAIGGNTLLSGGILWLPMNGLNDTDTREQALTYLKHLRQDEPIEDEILEAFVDTNAELVEFASQATNMDCKEFTWFGDYHPDWEGGMDSGRSIVFVAEGNSDSDFSANAYALLENMAAASTDNDGELLVSSPATHLVWRVQENGVPEVLGVEAESEELGTIKIKARKGVLLSAGGFGENEIWKRTFLRGLAPYSAGSHGQDGDGIRMAMELGAELRNMHACWGHSCYTALAEEQKAKGGPAFHQFDQHKQGAILVNRYGKRFMNEASDYASQWRMFHTWENWHDNRYANIPAYLVCDSEMVNTYGIDYDGRGSNPVGEIPEYFLQADTPEELATLIDVDPTNLSATIERFNGFVDNAYDEDFHRGENYLDTKMFTNTDKEGPLATLGKIQTPPFYATEVSPCEIGTCGGPRINEHAQAYHVSGELIPRLFVAGNNSGVGGPGDYGGAGGTCGPALTFSYIAAKSITALEPWE